MDDSETARFHVIEERILCLREVLQEMDKRYEQRFEAQEEAEQIKRQGLVAFSGWIVAAMSLVFAVFVLLKH